MNASSYRYGSSSTRIAAPVWDTSVEMLASSMMIVTISEEHISTIGYSSQTPSSTTNRGWGNSLSRKSYKTNLSMLSVDDNSMDTSMDISSDTSSDDTDEWGFFTDDSA
jgi:hypothetical protein